MKTQPPHQHVLDECKKWVTSMPNSNVRFYKEDIIAGGVHISLGLISGEYVLLQKHVETVKIRRAFNLKVVIVRKSKNSCTDIELFLHNYIMPFCHYTTPGIFSSSFISWRKATVWKSMNWDTIWYFFKDMYILACECNSLFGEIQCSLMNEMTNMWVAHKKCPVINQTTTRCYYSTNSFISYPTDQ